VRLGDLQLYSRNLRVRVRRAMDSPTPFSFSMGQLQFEMGLVRTRWSVFMIMALVLQSPLILRVTRWHIVVALNQTRGFNLNEYLGDCSEVK
jgi:hypothetical protein